MPATNAMSVGNVSAGGLCSIYAQEKEAPPAVMQVMPLQRRAGLVPAALILRS